jgi:adenylate kinase family enzyme
LRIAILGNSGSGKSTLARWVAETASVSSLDLDTLAWEPNQIAIPRDPVAACADVAAFCQSRVSWVVEGCYASLITAALPFGPRLVLLNPGEEQCLANCRARPWEPHKYASPAEQHERLDYLLTWVSEYYTRQGDMSLSGHKALLRGYPGPKVELLRLPLLEPPDPELLAWVN